jgi:hypothetical protein
VHRANNPIKDCRRRAKVPASKWHEEEDEEASRVLIMFSFIESPVKIDPTDVASIDRFRWAIADVIIPSK